MITSPLVIRAGTAIMRVVPPSLLRSVAGAIGVLSIWAQPERYRIVLENMRYVLPNESERTRRRLARRTFRNLAQATVDLYRLPSATRSEILALVKPRGLENVDAALAMGKGVMIVTSHLGPYEVGPVFLAARGYPIHAMTEVLEPEVVAALASYRSSLGVGLFSTREGIRESLRLLGERQVIALVADRVIEDVSQKTEGIDMPFCSGVRSLPTGPAALAAKTGAPIVVGHIFRNADRGHRYVIEFVPPILPNGRGDAERRRLTERIAESLSAAVVSHPDEWYVFQPYWKSSDGD